MTLPHPPIGAYLRPVGRLYAYCYRVLATHDVTTDDDEPTTELERWGIEGRTPVRDGHQHTHWLRGLRQVAPGVWRDTTADSWGPMYYRLMPTPAGGILSPLMPVSGCQLSLF